ncbi:uncharacterized protein TRIVIDRAFT_227041 [Trichoderma virens Gv29-8]|uniref:DUF7708 domain-containing protein n=1 Tax=Hypocrea virens (strain Gv29-8 / FGSC 10586) TaxID=413071 RepID=G9N888_HYPVG|nr:uncharacterized protein TRIVIDRAFT_227041 [Trichoderma virens Gv29-8]EHK17197.1 hypothetical protein TRIVIDRAFT_227041 [Trichoderma virens Gv29-8]UKZ55615.1 hypothetical protein TrVGV298_009439 [Trichoderma virens]
MVTLETNAFSAWYTSSEETECVIDAQDVFKEALAEFSSEVSKDKKKQQWIVDSRYGNLESVLASVEEARTCYEEQKGNSKLRKALVQLSEKLYSYSSILDVLLPQQPEYSTLAYGAMKFLLLAVMNHHKLLSQLCTGLNGIAHIISRTQLIIRLYPTQQIRQVIVAIYVHILKFLLRALNWYRESKITHMLQAIKRPTELRYGDLLATISSLSDTMSKIALDSSHAEQRDMHVCVAQIMHEQKLTRENITNLMTAVSDIKISMVTEQGINASAIIEFRQRLSEVQLMQLLSQLSVAGLPDPVKAFQLLLFMSKRRQPKSSTGGQVHVSTIDLLKYIISQAVSVNKSIHTDAALIPRLMAHIDAKSEEDWITILASVLQGIPLLYIIIDVEILGQNLGTLTAEFWPAAFLRMFSKLSARNIGTVVKVALRELETSVPLLLGQEEGFAWRPCIADNNWLTTEDIHPRQFLRELGYIP